jgi:DNA mismatch repair protein MutS
MKKNSTSEDKKIISQSVSIYGEYFELHNKYAKIYGNENMVVLLEVGSFYEIYSLLSGENAETTYTTNIENICSICNLNIAEKKAEFNNTNVCMAGFRNYMLEKYIKFLTDNSITAIVYNQEQVKGKNKTFKRVLNQIYSPGTFLPFDTDSSSLISNNTMCVWIENITRNTAKQETLLICGISIINIFTGKSFIFEYTTDFSRSKINPSMFDELERHVSVYNPSEIIFLSSFEKKIVNKIIEIVGVSNKSIVHNIFIPTAEQEVVNCTKQTYIEYILSTFFSKEKNMDLNKINRKRSSTSLSTVLNICGEFNMNIVATQSFCYLLHFIQQHNPKLVDKIKLPVFSNLNERMILANHTLRQLNIIEDNNSKVSSNRKSVLSFLNKCCTSIGKREFHNQLLNPVFNEKWLNSQYSMIQKYIDCNCDSSFLSSLRKELKEIKDIEKINRNIIIQRVHPSSIYYLYKSIQQVCKIVKILNNVNIDSTFTYEQTENNEKKISLEEISSFSQLLFTEIEKNLYIEKCKEVNTLSTFEENIICSKINLNLDKLFIQYNSNIEILNIIKHHLNNFDAQKTYNPPDPLLYNSEFLNIHENDISEYVKIHETEKNGISFQITKKRTDALKKFFEKNENKNITICLGGIEQIKESSVDTSVLKNNEKIIIPFSDFKFTGKNDTTNEIECSVITKIKKELQLLKEQINNEISKSFSIFISQFVEKKYNIYIEIISKFVEIVDVIQCKSYIAIEYNYCRPVINIQDDDSESKVVAKDVRHCLLEHLQSNEIYVANDVSLDTKKGMLLYGINMSGKTSLIRSLGIAIILAQSGNYVPCSSFVYTPYRAIFSRILNNDNMFKGLSTFAVEMSELRVILNNADDKSLILGDEVCSGTENESALSIFVAALETLNKKNSSFIFATHFHEIVKYDEIKQMSLYHHDDSSSGLQIKHLSVIYDREKDELVYDRILKEGSGTSIYGLEILNSLYLSSDFIDRTFEIRNKYFPEAVGALSYKTSKYNSRKIKGICEVCNENVGEDIHHINEQKNANKKGFISTFHKNHLGNLMSICRKCHLKEHNNNNNLI